ncbi:hypothetical protein K3177_06590 [Qipengyuania sp. GH25]|uniref:VWFA domain-containing protein n=1 Tax=Qipengyuania pacifica TaxID=2860199 RepID=A0ABS7JDR2_9SPHN|nr:TadE/TadG family type IV pilus assembly protein [Qipengyuania aerophila]MBX7488175.1 hypothetical protein [Qipengyuania aerophila]
MIRTLRNVLTDTKGNTLAIFAAALVPLVAMIGSGLDLSFAYMARAKLQNACDAAVLAGRQSMNGNVWKKDDDGVNKDEVEAHKFFDFNFPSGILGARDVNFRVSKDPSDSAQIIGEASAEIPTAMMHIFGFNTIPIEANCDAKRDLGHNDVMLVLDTTGSMNDAPSIGGASKISRLRLGASGLFRALDDTANGAITRFGIVSYSHTVNVARSLKNRDILKEQLYAGGEWEQRVCKQKKVWWSWQNDGCTTKTYDRDTDAASTGTVYIDSNNRIVTYSPTFDYKGDEIVHIDDTQWAKPANNSNQNIRDFRTSGIGCIEERSSVGQTTSPFKILQTVSQQDIDAVAANGNDTDFQWGRYDPVVQQGESQDGCPSESQKLETYASESAFNDAINDATANVTGGTYHDIGMLWGARFLSPTGMFASENPTKHGIVPVNRHIVFMTDGRLDTGNMLYSAYGIDRFHNRIQGSGSQDRKHINRFHSICDQVKSTGTTIWVIALDETDTDEIDDCATSDAHFYTSDGSDLESVFETIGRGIGNLRLTR